MRTNYRRSNANRCKVNLNFAKQNDQHPAWKEDAGKSAMHEWVKKHKGRASDYPCEHCNKKKAQHWANKDHKYKRKLEDYMALCAKCHKAYDKLNNSKK